MWDGTLVQDVSALGGYPQNFAGEILMYVIVMFAILGGAVIAAIIFDEILHSVLKS